jgi:hypothetical protein
MGTGEATYAVMPAEREARVPESIIPVCGHRFRDRARSASKTRVNALAGAPRNDGGKVGA